MVLDAQKEAKINQHPESVRTTIYFAWSLGCTGVHSVLPSVMRSPPSYHDYTRPTHTTNIPV